LSILPKKFYQRDTVVVAKELLGKKLTRKIGNYEISGTIIETEAYSTKMILLVMHLEISQIETR